MCHLLINLFALFVTLGVVVFIYCLWSAEEDNMPDEHESHPGDHTPWWP